MADGVHYDHDSGIYVLVYSDLKVKVWCHLTEKYMNVTPEWINNHMPSKVWDNIMYSFPNLNSCTVEVWEMTLYWMKLPSYARNKVKTIVVKGTPGINMGFMLYIQSSMI